MVITCEDAAATQAAGAALGRVVAAGDLVGLTGDLGAGKTTFIQGLARGLAIAGPIQSPTFTIVNEHRGRLLLVHVDLYRLESGREMHEIGLGETLTRDDAVVAVEWWPRLAEHGQSVP